MNDKKSIFNRSSIVKKLSVQYITSIISYLLLLCVTAVLSYTYLSNETWQETDRWWPLLHWIDDNIKLFFICVFLAGALIITLFFVALALYYLKKMTDASEQIAMHSENSLIMPAALKSVQDELNQVLEKSRRNEELAKEAEKRKNDLIVYLAHDLKTPLTSVIGYLSLLAETPDLPSEQRCKYTGIALEKAERLENLINEFFDITRFNLSVMVIEKQQVNLSLMINQLASEFIAVMKNKKLGWDLQIEDNIFISCDIDKMERVFDNLIRNAINYSYTDSNIIMSLDKHENEVKIIIKNRGKTIPKEKLDHIFEQFFRLDSSRTTATGGAGLGLAIAKEIVEKHGGKITAQSENETVCFVTSLPV